MDELFTFLTELIPEGSLLQGVAASLIAAAIGATAGALFHRAWIVRRFRNAVSASLKPVSEQIRHSYPRNDIYAKEDAERIIKRFEVHKQRLSHVEAIVRADAIEKLEVLVSSPEATPAEIREQLGQLNSSWPHHVDAIRGSFPLVVRELKVK